MRALRTLRPGAPGTMKLVEEYGDRLLCVRYRYDEQARKRYTTVELAVRESDWAPRGERTGWVRVQWGEKDLAIRVRQAGGRWDKTRRLWELPLKKAREMGLESRLVAPGDV
jgi:hypothetical protein